MSLDEPISRKEKKAQRDADRQKKGKKRKRDDVEKQDESEHRDEHEKDFIPLSAVSENRAEIPMDAGEITASKAKSRKRKAEDVNGDAPVSTSADATLKSRKRTKITDESKAQDGESEAVPAGDKNKSRFIVFVGNLPYSATDASVQTHFKKLMPFTLRHRTDPKTKKSKGFAFLEFENYDRMKTCLKLYHHSLFDPTAKQGAEVGDGEQVNGDDANVKVKSKNKAARRINVELTAGGGGSKAEGRKEKIKAKNVRLGEQRKRRAELEAKESEKAKRKEKKSSGGNAEPVAQEKAQADVVDDVQVDTGDMHPSRVARMKK